MLCGSGDAGRLVNVHLWILTGHKLAFKFSLFLVLVSSRSLVQAFSHKKKNVFLAWEKISDDKKCWNRPQSTSLKKKKKKNRYTHRFTHKAHSTSISRAMTVIMLFNSTIADNLHRFVVFNSSLETALFERLFFFKSVHWLSVSLT